MPRSNGPLVIAIKPKDKYRFWAAAMFIYTQQICYLKTLHVFRRFISTQNLITIILSGRNVAFTSKVRMDTMSVLPVVGKQNVERWRTLQWRDTRTKFDGSNDKRLQSY